MPRISVPTSAGARDGARFILDLDRRLEYLDRAILAAEWNLECGRSTRGSAPWQLRRASLLSDDRILAWVRSALGRDWSYPLGRRLELLERILLDTQVEQNPDVVELRSDLQRRIIAFRPRWKGRRVDRGVLRRVSRESRSEADRRRAFEALEPLHRPMEESLRTLVRIRNERARALGYRTFAEMRLGFQGLTPARLAELSETAGALARPQARALRAAFAEKTGSAGWHPWDFLYARHLRASLPDRLFPKREMLQRILRAVDEWGFRTDRMRFRVVYHDNPAGGVTLSPDPPNDVRILVNPGGGWLRYMVMFHEVGHAVHSASVRAPRHLLRWHENIPGLAAFHEGIGGLFEDLASNEAWLSRQPGIKADSARQFARRSREENLLDAAWHAGWLRTEQELYRNPDRDPRPSVQRFERSVFGYDEYPPLSFVAPFYVDNPTYASNYLLAILFGKQLTETLRERCGDPLWPNRRVGPWLTRNWFAPGSLYDWIPRVKEVTGRPFGVEALRRAAAA